jgi:branched-chain amino acid transport system substrate-binding protein
MYFSTHQLKGRRIGIPWADTPPGVVCYYDLEAKPLDVLNGKVKGSSKEAGSIPDLTYLGVPIKPATPDLTAQVTTILDYKPDVIAFSGQGADCWNLVSAMGRLGWTPTATPLVLSGSCIDYDAMKAAGDLAKGVYFIGTAGGLLSDPTKATNVRAKFEAKNYQTKPAQYGLAADQLNKGFATQGWVAMLSIWEMSSELTVKGTEVTGDNLAAAYKDTTDQHLYASTPLACAKAPAPYIAVCNSDASVSQWNGSELVPVVDRFSAIDLVAGTPLKPGP